MKKEILERGLTRPVPAVFKRSTTHTMQVHILRSKILRAEITNTRRDYEGSLAIDSELMEQVGFLPYEKILVGNIDSGERFETYIIPAPHGSLTFSLNGAAAHKGEVGELLVIMSFAQMTVEQARSWEPAVLVLGDHNKKIIELRPGHTQLHPDT